MQKYIGLLIDHIRDQAGKGIEFDIVSLLNWTTFDIIGELTFGEPFGALETKHGHPWIDNFFSTMKPVCILFELMEMPGGMFLMNTFIRPILKKKVKMADFVQEKIEKRVERGVGDRPDLMSFVLKNNDEGKGMSKREIITTFNVIIIAGSETTATLLSGAVFLLQKNPRVLQKLKDKVRGTFKDDKEINLLKVSACLTE
jgi:cytochrome P450